MSHVVLPPRRVPGSGCFFVECTCGMTAIGETRQQARDGMAGCRDAQWERWQAEGRGERDVAMLSDALRRGGSALESVPQQIKHLLVSREWEHFVTRLGKEVHHERFAEFVITPPLAGLGASVDLIQRLVADDKEALDLLDQALQNPHGGDHSKNDNITLAQPNGTSEAAALRRLRKDAPELHAEVLAGRLTAHGAMVRAGFRPKTVSVPIGRPDAVAAALRKHMTPADLARLAALLTTEVS